MQGQRIFLAGVGGQGTLTATNMLSLMALDKNIQVTSGEIHGMAQRGGIVESTVLLGKYLSPKIDHGQADVLLGFEPLETLRALPYLKKGGVLLSNSEPTMPIGVSMGNERYPDLDIIREKCSLCAASVHFLSCKTLGGQAGAVQSANVVLLGAFCASGASLFNSQDLHEAISNYLPPKIVELNLKAARLGAESLNN